MSLISVEPSRVVKAVTSCPATLCLESPASRSRWPGSDWFWPKRLGVALSHWLSKVPESPKNQLETCRRYTDNIGKGQPTPSNSTGKSRSAIRCLWNNDIHKNLPGPAASSDSEWTGRRGLRAKSRAASRPFPGILDRCHTQGSQPRKISTSSTPIYGAAKNSQYDWLRKYPAQEHLAECKAAVCEGREYLIKCPAARARINRIRYPV